MVRKSVRQARWAGRWRYARWRWRPWHKPKIFSRRCSAHSEAAAGTRRKSSGRPMPTKASRPVRKTSVRSKAATPVHASPPMAAARHSACAAATDAISRCKAPTRKAGRPRATASARRARPRWSMAAISTMPPPRAASRIRNCRTRSAIATRSWRDAPATARNSSASRRSGSRTTRRYAGATLVAGADGLMVAGRGADRRGASLNFTPASKALQARYQHVPVVAKE